MSKQEEAQKRWETLHRMARIRDLMHDARDYSFPAGQMQAGIQLGTVEVPWLLNYIEELKHGTGQQDLEVDARPTGTTSRL
jgi:hypothetical protein